MKHVSGNRGAAERRPEERKESYMLQTVVPAFLRAVQRAIEWLLEGSLLCAAGDPRRSATWGGCAPAGVEEY